MSNRAGGAVEVFALQRNAHDTAVQFDVFRNAGVTRLDKFLGNDPFAPGPHVTGQHTRYDAFARIGVYTCDEIYIFAYHTHAF